jgi:hypothetical protein
MTQSGGTWAACLAGVKAAWCLFIVVVVVLFAVSVYVLAESWLDGAAFGQCSEESPLWRFATAAVLAGVGVLLIQLCVEAVSKKLFFRDSGLASQDLRSTAGEGVVEVTSSQPPAHCCSVLRGICNVNTGLPGLPFRSCAHTRTRPEESDDKHM